MTRAFCYECYRPQTSCMCEHIHPIQTNTKFIILMHPKEYRKTKNGTGHLTNKSLVNSEIHIGIDFTKNASVQTILNDKKYEPFLLYPGKDSILLNEEKIETTKKLALFIIDSTWPCSKKILRQNPFLQTMRSISFEATQLSQFHIKTQPQKECLSTIESTLSILQHLHTQQFETITSTQFERFLTPFKAMVDYQLQCAHNNKNIRFK
ncbi:tRNA-uridine aminocarboxypropyltransferase [Candidatus Marinarcus aquaticus]|uniref:tRNA-uridine aminocarboxypropyltransferase n=1 Tax=Candidatus Marinarcus aquaticus TaxID=2044504 RepID=A0A4Q0XS16_9BACT|nr:tRNA-uridine aminocarboxypropyltransferase [Candidatus Marinarcus aquaticus]RXJ60052.1 hypothetical protein CRV04_03305 [Candidatus Marinarcus aquaticus]